MYEQLAVTAAITVEIAVSANVNYATNYASLLCYGFFVLAVLIAAATDAANNC